MMKVQRESISFQHFNAIENALEASIHNPGLHKDETPLLDKEVHHEIVHKNQEMDHEEIEELRKDLGKKKRQALVADILNNPRSPTPVDSKSFRLYPDSNDPLDVVVENNTARK